jgi:hypothetical protein
MSSALAVVIFAAGCGGGGDQSSAEAVGPTKATYIKSADMICTKTNVNEANSISKWEVEHGAVEPGFKPPTAVQELRVIVPIIRQEVREIAALKSPPGDEAEVRAFVSAYEGAAKETIPDLLDGESKKYETAFKLMQDYGFKVCGTS